jgi:probable rRNA maturation factor
MTTIPMIVVEVEDDAWTGTLPGAAELARQAAEAALAGHAGEIAILLTGDEAVRDLNLRFLGKDKATNVLAFPDIAAAEEPGRLGDIALAFGVCRAEATGQAKPLADHLRHLVIHGVLHLLGYDHQRDEDATRMEAVERRLLAGMNIPDPYQAKADVRRS